MSNKGFKHLLAYCMALVMVFTMADTVAGATQSVSVKTNKKANLSLYVGKSAKLKAAGNTKNVTWSSTNKSVVKVSRTGAVTAKAAGSANIIGNVKGSSKKLICKVKVGNYITGMKLQSASMVTLSVGKKSQIKASVVGKKALYTGFSYSSSDKKVVSVSKAGKITAVGAGMADVTVKTKAVNKKGKSYSKKVVVYVPGDDAPQGTAVPAPTGSSTVIVSGAATTAPNVSSTPGNTSQPADNTPQPGTTTQPPTLQDEINQIVPPTDTQLLAATFVVQDGNELRTLYFINRNYTETMSLMVFGYPMSTSKNVQDALHTIVTAKNMASYIRVDGERVMHVSDDQGVCAAKNLATDEIVYFQVYETDPSYGTPYALIVAQGDTRDKVQVK